MKKNWNSPEIEALAVSATMHGADFGAEYDNIYVNDDGSYGYEYKAEDATSGPEV